VQSRHLRLKWNNRIVEALPSEQIRQIPLNLLLNAAQTSPEDETLNHKLTLSVGNVGEAIHCCASSRSGGLPDWASAARTCGRR